MYIFSVADGRSAAHMDLQLFSSFTAYADPNNNSMPDLLRSHIPPEIRVETSLHSILETCEKTRAYLPSTKYTAKYYVYLYGEKRAMTQQLAESLRQALVTSIKGHGHISSWNASHVKPSVLRQSEMMTVCVDTD